MDWWVWAIVGWAAAAVAVTALVAASALRGVRATERRAAEAAQDLVRLTDDLERRIHEVRKETGRVHHRIEIVDEGRDVHRPFPEDLEESDRQDDPA